MQAHRKASILPAALLLLIAGAIMASERMIEPERGAELACAGALVIDVRSAREVAESGIVAGALNIPHENVEEIRAAVGPDMARPVVVYCRTGRRSGLVKDALEAAGYSGVVNAGGYKDITAQLDADARGCGLR